MTLRIWLSSVDEVDLAPAQGLFSPDELVRAKRPASPRSGRRFLVRRWMARAVLGEAGDVWWSVSSSAGLAGIAVSPWRVGLDIEERRASQRWEGIARRRYTEDERRAVAGSPERFLEFWTLKEAYLKALGQGLAGGLDSLDCTRLCRSTGDWMESAAHPGWQFRQFEPQPGFVAAVAVEGVPETIEVRRWEPDPDAASAGRANP